MGASTKEGDSTKIGFFGSGNKYAIATLLRKGYGLKIFSGLREVEIMTKDVSFGGSSFKQIFIDGQSTSLTTRMGPEWEVWFALREFVCNAIDEGGYQISVEGSASTGKTTVWIEYRDEVEEFFNNLNKYILRGEALHEVKHREFGRVAIIEKDEVKMNVYRKGISVIGGYSYESLFDYDFETLEINESRILQFMSQVIRGSYYALASGTEEIVRRFLQGMDSNAFEHQFDHWEGMEFSEAWHEALKTKHIYPEDIVRLFAPEDLWDAIILKRSLAEALKKNFPDLVVAGGQYGGGWIETQPSDEGRANVNKAVEELTSFGIHVASMIRFGKSPVESVTAEYSRDDDVIILSVDYLLDYENLILVLIEEYYHSLGFSDGSRSFERRLMEDILALKRQVTNSSFILEK